MSRLYKSVLLGAAAGLALAGVAQAQTTSEEALEGLVVTAAGFEQKITEAPASITVLPRTELQQFRAASIAEALTYVEGVDVGGAVGKTGGLSINIRGMGSDYTLILIDGRRQNTPGSVTPNGFGETSTSFMPPVSAIERIEVVRGPVSTLYGSDAMGGVVNIITRKVSDRWTGSVSANATIQGDSEFGNLYGGDLFANGPLVKDRLGLTVRGSLMNREQSDLTFQNVAGTDAPITGFGRSATKSENRTVGGRLTLTPHEDHDIWFDADYSTQWYDNSKGQLGTNTLAGGYDQFLEFNRQQYALAHDWRLGFGTLSSNLSRGVTETRGRIIPPGVPGAGGPRTLEAVNTIFDTKLNSQFRNHTFTVGGQYWDAQMQDGVAPALFEFTQWAGFLEDEWRFLPSMALTLGGRYDHHSTFGGQFSPRAYLVWTANEMLTVKGGVARGFKTPRLEQLTPGINGFGNQGRLPLIGTPTLTPETSTSYEAGVYFDNLDGFSANLTAFNNTFTDKIAAGVPVPNCAFGLTQAQYNSGQRGAAGCVDVGFFPASATFGQSINIDEAVTRGLEAALRWRFADDWTLGLNYTLTDSEQKSGTGQGQPLTDTPKHMLNGNLRWTVTDKLNAWVRAEYRSSRYRGAGVIQNALGDYKAYALAHLGAGYQIRDNVTLNATVYNLFNTDFVRQLPYGTPVQYAPEYTNNQEPRRLWVSLRVDF